MTRTPRPVSDDSSPETPSPFWGDEDEEPNHLLAEYAQLCPGGLDEDAVEEDNEVRAAEHPPAPPSICTTAEAKAATATAATEEQGDKKKKKRRRKGYSKFSSRKEKRKGHYVPVSPSRRKQAP